MSTVSCRVGCHESCTKNAVVGGVRVHVGRRQDVAGEVRHPEQEVGERIAGEGAVERVPPSSSPSKNEI